MNVEAHRPIRTHCSKVFEKFAKTMPCRVNLFVLCVEAYRLPNTTKFLGALQLKDIFSFVAYMRQYDVVNVWKRSMAIVCCAHHHCESELKSFQCALGMANILANKKNIKNIWRRFETSVTMWNFCYFQTGTNGKEGKKYTGCSNNNCSLR